MESTDHDQTSWEKYVNSLAAVHYSDRGEVYQAIPDRTQGDGGLEGFSTCGCGVQAYFDKARNASERTKSQKKKITDDLKKLDSNKDFWSETLDGQILNHWFLVVPIVDDKSVITHARRKAKELRAKKLSFIADTFQVFIVTDDYFPEAKGKLGAYGVRPLSLSDTEAGKAEVETKIRTDATFIKNLDRKLMSIHPGDLLVEERNRLLQQFLDSENIGEDINQQSPTLWEQLKATLAAKSKSVSLETNLDDTPANKRLKAVRVDVAEMLKQHSQIPQHAVETISWGTVTDWMGKCPLRFKENKDA